MSDPWLHEAGQTWTHSHVLVTFDAQVQKRKIWLPDCDQSYRRCSLPGNHFERQPGSIKKTRSISFESSGRGRSRSSATWWRRGPLSKLLSENNAFTDIKLTCGKFSFGKWRLYFLYFLIWLKNWTCDGLNTTLDNTSRELRHASLGNLFLRKRIGREQINKITWI